MTPKPTPPLVVQPPAWWDRWAFLQQKMHVGRQFEYLGLRLVVTGHREYRAATEANRNGFFIPGQMPAFITEYVNGAGEICQHVFELGSWPILERYTEEFACPSGSENSSSI